MMAPANQALDNARRRVPARPPRPPRNQDNAETPPSDLRLLGLAADIDQPPPTHEGMMPEPSVERVPGGEHITTTREIGSSVLLD